MRKKTAAGPGQSAAVYPEPLLSMFRDLIEHFLELIEYTFPGRW